MIGLSLNKRVWDWLIFQPVMKEVEEGVEVCANNNHDDDDDDTPEMDDDTDKRMRKDSILKMNHTRSRPLRME